MSGRKWQPGDVAVATFDHGGSGLVFRVVGVPTSWCDMAGVSVPADQLEDVRPLVVIDPEDREQVKRLLRGYSGWTQRGADDDIADYPQYVDDMQRALREFANPTPPKCGAALLIKGEHFPCDANAGHGLPHGNRDAEAVWGESE